MRTKELKSAPVGVIGKVLRILELLDQNPAGLELKEIAQKTGINKSTALRFLNHLHAESYLLRDSHGAFILGPRITRLGGAAKFEATLTKISRPVLEKLRGATGETANLAVLDGAHVLMLDILESSHRFRLVSQVGSHGAIHATALGKAILANLDEGSRKEELLASISFEASTPRTITNVEKLKKDLLQTKKQGFAHDDEEAFLGARCIGAAIFGADGAVVAAVSISGPISRISKDKLPFFAAQVRQAAREISLVLGYRIPKSEHAVKSQRQTAH